MHKDEQITCIEFEYELLKGDPYFHKENMKGRFNRDKDKPSSLVVMVGNWTHPQKS